MHLFPSAEWLAAFKDAINANSRYQAAAKAWTYGPVALLIKADPTRGLAESKGLWLDLDRGICRDARLVGSEEATRAPFCILGEYDRWKQVIGKELDPIKGMMQRKLELRGQMSTLVRFVQAAKELVESSQQVPTRFL